MNIFEEVSHRLSSKTRIRSLFKDVHAEDLERIISRMNDVLTEKQEVRQKEEARRQEKLDQIESIRKMMVKSGVSMDDLGSLELDTQKRRRNVQKYTFEYQSEAGDTVQWKGATTGRLPRDFQNYLERTGKKRLDCALEEIVESEESEE